VDAVEAQVQLFHVVKRPEEQRLVEHAETDAGGDVPCPFQGEMVEGREYGVFEPSVFLQNRDGLFLEPWPVRCPAFQLHVQEHFFGNQFQHFGKGGDFLAPEFGGEPFPRIKAPDFAERQVADVPGAACGPLHGPVVMDDWFSVPAQLDVKLETVAPLADAQPESRNRVFRGVPRSSPVSQNKHLSVTSFTWMWLHLLCIISR
jgi:hypothetical protein